MEPGTSLSPPPAKVMRLERPAGDPMVSLAEFEYPMEALLSMRVQERRWPVRSCYSLSPPHSSVRRARVEWTFNTGKRFLFHPSTIHLAVRFVDFFLDKNNVSERRVHFVSAVALLLAAKLNERDIKVPHLADLNEQLPEKRPLREFQLLELRLMAFYKWNINMPTPINFVEILVALTLDDLQSVQQSKRDFYTKAFRTFIDFFIKKSIEEECFAAPRPSVVAAAIVYTSRTLVAKIPPWTDYLTRLCGGDSPRTCTDLVSCTVGLLDTFFLRDRYRMSRQWACMRVRAPFSIFDPNFVPDFFRRHVYRIDRECQESEDAAHTTSVHQ